jgi:hypothetical protein
MLVCHEVVHRTSHLWKLLHLNRWELGSIVRADRRFWAASVQKAGLPKGGPVFFCLALKIVSRMYAKVKLFFCTLGNREKL